ncbi:hypothetical protein M422DRAFT_249900 [Sphaerobolus stellatus SS14]|uniref:Uncharacterized protein n=1 Tax=Sphaerobolus stellatus (strain SS14) TaxID=990650 RepID=A0A0C9W3R6_SPHS4|nr:hypothetical protein M422DRAFT_249900 [Sphaerobolus stellatus SS14]
MDNKPNTQMQDINHTVTEAWPELVRYQDDYYRLLEEYNALKDTVQSAEKKAEDRRAKINELYEKLGTHQATIKSLGNQVQSLEEQLQGIKGNSDELPNHEELLLANKHLQQELDYYVGRARYALYGKDANWVTRNGYRISDIPVSDGEDDDEDLAGLPTVPEEIPQVTPAHPSAKLAHPVGKLTRTTLRSFMKQASLLLETLASSLHQKESLLILLPPLLEYYPSHWPALRGASNWVMESDVHDSEMHRLYVEGKALQPHERSPDHTAVIFRIDEYTRSLPGLLRNLVVHHDDPNWMINVIQTFNVDPSGILRNLQLEGLHINVDDADIWYWLNLIKPKHHGAEAEVLLRSIFSTVGKWDQMIAGQWKRNDSPFLCSPTPVRYKTHRNQKFGRNTFAYWLGCKAGVTPDLAQDKLEPYLVHQATKTIWNKVTHHFQLWANEIASLKGGPMNQFRVQDDLLLLIQESPFYYPPSTEEPMDQDEPDPEPTLSQPMVGSSSLADRLDYGEGGSFTHPPVDAPELRAHISYFDSLAPQGTVRESTVELTVELYTDNLE